MSREQLSYLLRLVKGGMLERATTMIEQELAKPESINHAAWHWHNLYQAKCKEFHDKQTMLGTEIVALEEELAELKEEQLAKPEQEPVQFLLNGARYKVALQHHFGNSIVGLPEHLNGQWVALVDATDGKHLNYTAPPRKPRVGLTREEIVEAYCSIHVKEWAIGGMDDVLPFTRAIEAKLKEKNT